LPGSAEFRATMNRLPDADSVLGLIDRFYDPLIARGVIRRGEADAPIETEEGYGDGRIAA
jgi:hypothetical protein